MKKVEKYTRRLFRDIIRNLKTYEQSCEAGHLHNIRVEIKKVKAIINLVKDNRPRFKAHKQFKPLRDIFRGAGDIRQAEVLFQLLINYGVNNLEKDSLLDTNKSVTDDFIHHIPVFIDNCKRSKNKLVKQARTLDHKKIVKSLEKFEKQLRKALTGKIKFDLIHRTRKLVKEVIYISDIHGDIKKKKRKFFDDLQELIGSVHDKQMLIVLLRKPTKIEYQKALADLEIALEADKKSIVESCSVFYKAKDVTIA